MKKTVSVFLALIAIFSLCFALSACSNGNDIVGTWKASGTYGDYHMRYTFYEDGSAIGKEYNGEQETGVASESYAWEFNEDDNCFYIWAAWAGAYESGKEIKQKVTFSKDKKSFTVSHEGDSDRNCFANGTTFRRV